jgi:hypothetical protein
MLDAAAGDGVHGEPPARTYRRQEVPGVSPGVLTPEFNRCGAAAPRALAGPGQAVWFRSASSWKLPHNYLHVAGDGPRLVAIIGC